MSISIFLDDINGYNEAVERFAYNKKAVDDANTTGANTTNFSVAAMVLDNGQIVEMDATSLIRAVTWGHSAQRPEPSMSRERSLIL